MNSNIGLLGALAALQLILIAVVTFAPGSTAGDSEPLLTLNAAEVTSLVISDGDSEVEVSKTGDGWQVAGVPADADKVSSTLDKLASLDAAWPVATSSGSAERFEVSEENFQRRLRVANGDTQLGELYLGTSPGYQRVHARRAGSNDIYSVALSNYELGVNADAWLDKGLLATAATPTSITLDFVAEDEPREEVLRNAEEGWLFNGGAADQDAARTYANRFTTMRVLGLADSQAPASPLAKIRIVDGDKTRMLTLSRGAEEDDYVVADDSREGKYRLATYIAEQLLMTDADFSVKQADTEPNQDELGAS